MNRRGFIGSILGAVAWSKSKLKVPVSPAASAIQPTCEKPYQYQVRFVSRDGVITEPSPVHRFGPGQTITLSSVPKVRAADYVIVSAVAAASDIPMYYFNGNTGSQLGIRRDGDAL